MQSFFYEKSSPILCGGGGGGGGQGGGGGGEETLCFIFKYFPISKSSSLILWYKLSLLKQNYLATVLKVI